MHHSVHYPHYIIQLGPLKQFWCMRFEGKHSYFKTVARTTGNFVNAPLTLAKRHQQWLTNKIRETSGNFMTQDLVQSKYARLVPACSLVHWGQLVDVIGHNKFRVKVLDWIEVNSSKIKAKESIVLLPVNNAIQCKFGLVSAIYCCEELKELLLLWWCSTNVSIEGIRHSKSLFFSIMSLLS